MGVHDLFRPSYSLHHLSVDQASGSQRQTFR